MFNSKRNTRVVALLCLIIICLVFLQRSLFHAASFQFVPQSNEFIDLSADLSENLTLLSREQLIKEDLVYLNQGSNSSLLIDSHELNIFDVAQQDKHAKVATTTTSATPTLAAILKDILHCHDRKLVMEKMPYGSYWLLKNYIRGSVSTHIGCAETITYTANGDYTFFESLPLVLTSWLAPISFAIFAPGYDFNATMDAIQYVRNCLPESELIRKFVTFHIYFPNTHMPSYIPLDEEAAISWPYECDVMEAPYENVNRTQMYKTIKNLRYPINVGRNIARKAVNTYFIFACDIELIPSLNLAQDFLQMIARNHSYIFEGNALRVFPLPVFELHANASIPTSKTELKRMLKTKMAIPFHSRLCKNCHLVPNQTEWLNATELNNELSVFTVGKRIERFKYWEPFYISNNKEPLFDERVTWEGQSNKRIQGYAMCLLDYEYHVLYPAFLVHSPGIKVFNKNSTRLKYVPAMNYLIKHTIEPEYRILYGQNPLCRT